jgi:plasmid stability protein
MHWQHNACMTSITIRNVPPEVRDKLAMRAARSGRSLQEHLRLELIELADKPSVEEIFERARRRLQASPTTLTAAKILEYRDADRT